MVEELRKSDSLSSRLSHYLSRDGGLTALPSLSSSETVMWTDTAIFCCFYPDLFQVYVVVVVGWGLLCSHRLLFNDICVYFS